MAGRTDSIAVGREVVALEAAALRALEASIGAAFDAAIEAFLNASGRIIVTGMGKSGHVARKIAATLASTGTPAFYVHPAEASHGDLGMVCPGDVVLALSRSGETGELSDLVSHAAAENLVLIGITSAAGSTLASRAAIALILPDVAEACSVTRAPTTSTTMMMALGDALAVALMERKGFSSEAFKRFHPGGRLGARLKTVSDLMVSGDAAPLVPEGLALPEALAIMSEKGLGCLCVVDGEGAPRGILTDGDIRRLVARGGQAETPDEIMTRNPVTVSPDAPADETLALMNERRITQLIVVDPSGAVGLVHLHDFLRAGIG